MKYFSLLFLVCVVCSCGGSSTEPEQAQPPEKFQNVIILLDLSSRVKAANQAQKDQDIISNILSVFEASQRRYAFQISKDVLSLAIAHQSSTIYDIYKIGKDDFKIKMLADEAKDRMNKPKFDEKKTRFQNAVTALYEEAVKSPTNGADIWGFFCNDWNSFYQPSMKNKVIILTDGYLEFDSNTSSKRPKGTYMSGFNLLRNKDNWQKIYQDQKLKLKACPKDIADTEVLVLEVSPKEPSINTNEFEILEKFWVDWFKEMQIDAKVFPTADISGNTGDQIRRFLKRE